MLYLSLEAYLSIDNKKVEEKKAQIVGFFKSKL